jgi:signal transduction histidine kinase
VAERRSPLTPLSFRRDVRLFLSVLACYFAVVVVALVFMLAATANEAREATTQQWNVVADRVADEVTSAAAHGSSVDATLTAARARYGLVDVAIARTPPPFAPANVSTLTRKTPAGTLRISFDDSAVSALRRRVMVTTAVAIIAAIGGAILALLYIPRITEPIEKMLAHAGELETRAPGVDEQQYLIETFRKSIEKLRNQQEELTRLHDEQKLRADDFERVTAALTRSITSGLIAIDPAARIVDVNEAGRDILHLGGAELARPIEDVLPPGALAATLRGSFEQRTPVSRREVDTTTADGQPVVVGLTTVPLHNEGGEFLGMLALFTDLTAVRQLEKRVRDLQSLADLGEISASIAHELRNSLSTIHGYLRLAQRQGQLDDTRAKIQSAEAEASALSETINSLLNFARPMTIDAQPVALRQVVDDVVMRLNDYAAGVPMRVEGEATIDADRTLLPRAVENLVRNAIDAVREKAAADGEIDIAIESAPPSIRIRDNGVGIDPETASRLFLPFHSRKAAGLGLGLPLARKIVLLHGGSIDISGAPGVGATVTVTFPAHAGGAGPVTIRNTSRESSPDANASLNR